jgi:hypothetical protein
MSMTTLPKIRRGATSVVRNALLRKPTHALIVLLGTLALPAAVLAAPLPASAAGPHVCETNGNYCIGAPGLSNDAGVFETLAGRDITLLFLGNAQYKLVVNAAPSECLAAANNGEDVVLHHCDGGLGTVWILHINPNGHLQFQNREFPTKYLAGHNNASQFQVKPLGLSGWFYNFDQVA